MGEGVGHAPRSDPGPISAIWPDSAHTCVACTSASHANASDVFIFFTACAAALKELFAQDPATTGIPRTLANTITDKFNDRYNELFANDIYFCAFAFDPRSSFPCYVM